MWKWRDVEGLCEVEDNLEDEAKPVVSWRWPCHPRGVQLLIMAGEESGLSSGV